MKGVGLMEKTILSVEGMSCEHCVKAVTKAVGALAGVEDVAVDLNAKTVTVKYDPGKSPLDKIKFEIEDQGYDVIG
jgi:copper chaperone